MNIALYKSKGEITMKKISNIFISSLLLLAVLLIFMECSSPGDSGDDENSTTGNITGYAYYSDEANHSGIIIIAEKLDGSMTSSVKMSIASGNPVNSVITGQTTTDSSGFYELNQLEPGRAECNIVFGKYVF